MGWTPAMVDATGLWEFSAAVTGWNRAQGGEPEAQAPTPEEHDAMVARYG